MSLFLLFNLRNLLYLIYRWLMEGLSIDQPKAHSPVKGLEII